MFGKSDLTCSVFGIRSQNCGYSVYHGKAFRPWCQKARGASPSPWSYRSGCRASAACRGDLDLLRTVECLYGLEGLVTSDLSPKTIQKHVDNLWALGGEIIRDLHENPSLSRKSIELIIGDRIDDEGGHLLYAMESAEDQQRSFDSTCKKLYRFLTHSSR
jgi:hypothetical protein